MTSSCSLAAHETRTIAFAFGSERGILVNMSQITSAQSIVWHPMEDPER